MRTAALGYGAIQPVNCMQVLTQKTPNSVDALDKIFNDKADGEGEIGVLMDLDDEEYVKSDNVFKGGLYLM